ncbi:hypothetical protein HYH02_006129 [Chlamydomonas schloesseri]|uniref:Uncharacterized protein n=1 Tax=Chlamydomonas schloesseri TaxID=2026947 RepID=A0A836B668_9CHLO|nr:hypothetical protein HYH02_006129 [Chlamydomonas schloesseri]|eukprot:KAG2448777.1 hypothetical protein HYH02_006129 [Chlamydomonas schloesseri]
MLGRLKLKGPAPGGLQRNVASTKLVNTTPHGLRPVAVSAASGRRSAAPPQDGEESGESSRTLRPRRSLFPSRQPGEDGAAGNAGDSRPSTSYERSDRSRDIVDDRYSRGRISGDAGSSSSSSSSGGRGGAGVAPGRARGGGFGGGRRDTMEWGGRDRDRDRYEGRDEPRERRSGGRGGRGGGGGGRGGRGDGERGRRPRRDAADADADAPPAEPKVGLARAPGAKTGNRPLPYDLPIVRPYDGDKGTFFAGASWRGVGASEEVVAALRTLGIQRPSHIQAAAFTAFNAHSDRSALVLADQAGSGKTMAYLLPLLQALRADELAAGGRVTQPRCPRGIVVAPTVELVQQVLRVARALSGAGLRLRTAAFTGGQADDKARAASYRTQRELLGEGVDLLVATPGRLQQHLADGGLRLDGCRALVMDEVDVLLGERAAFLEQVAPLRAAAPSTMRFVLATATLPQHIFAQLREVWPDLMPVFGPGLHRTAAGLVEELVDCSGGDDISEESGRKRKLEALQTVLDRHKAARTMVFCNKIDACRDVENYLRREDPQQKKYRVLPYHEAIRDEIRADNMALFLQPVGGASEPAAAAAAAAKQQRKAAAAAAAAAATRALGRDAVVIDRDEAAEAAAAKEGAKEGEAEAPAEPALVLVATDRTSRGIDVLYCEHVVLFDFPRDPSEYVRRVGRTARGANGRGTVSSLVLGRQVPLAKQIIERNQKGMPVHTVPE